MTHEGRRSGRTYQTSLGTCPYGDGFLLPLGYGPHTDWYQNIMAAGACTLEWKGHTYQLERPEVMSGPEAVAGLADAGEHGFCCDWPESHDFVWRLHQSKEETVESPRIKVPVTQHPAGNRADANNVIAAGMMSQ